MELRRVAEAGGDEHLAALRMPAPESCGAKLQIGPGVNPEFGWDLRHAFDHKIRRRRRGGGEVCP
jgi:hypothetical protein